MAIDLDKYMPKTRLTAEIFDEMETESIIATISDMEEVHFDARDGRPAEDKLNVHFAELDLPLMLNRSNLKFLIENCGKDTEAWNGKRVRLVRTLVYNPSQRKQTPSIGLDVAPVKKAKPKVVAPVEDEDEDDPYAKD